MFSINISLHWSPACHSPELPEPRSALCCPPNWAGRRVSKFDHISDYMRDVMHWLSLRQRIEFRVAVLGWYSLIRQVPAYLTNLCRPSLSARSTRHLRSAEQGLLDVPFARTSTTQSRAFSVVGPLVWNGLPLALQSLPRVFSQKFLQQLKTTLFGPAGVGSASE